MVSNIINCLVRRKTSDYHGVWLPVPCLSSECFQFSFLSLCLRCRKPVYRAVYHQNANQVSVCAEQRDGCRSNSDLPRRRSGNRAVFLARMVGRQGGEISSYFRTPFKGFGQENCLFHFVSFRIRKIFRKFCCSRSTEK